MISLGGFIMNRTPQIGDIFLFMALACPRRRWRVHGPIRQDGALYIIIGLDDSDAAECLFIDDYEGWIETYNLCDITNCDINSN